MHERARAGGPGRGRVGGGRRYRCNALLAPEAPAGGRVLTHAGRVTSVITEEAAASIGETVQEVAEGLLNCGPGRGRRNPTARQEADG